MLLKFSEWLVYDILKLSPETMFGGAVNFFVYDSIKIILMLFIIVFITGFLRTYLPEHKIREWMNRKGIIGNIFAAVFGVITPFCSCSSIPIFLGFLEAGISLGVAFTFLITSPLVNEYLVILMLGFFGWKITVLYVLSGMIIGILLGVILGRMSLGKYLVMDLITKRDGVDGNKDDYKGFLMRVKFGIKEAVSITRKIWVWVLFGVAVGAGIHNYIPSESIQNIIGKAGIFSVPVATIIGVPMYGSCAAIVPIAVVLFQKGIPLGTALSFMMAVSTLSLPEAIMLRRAMRLELIMIFFGVTALAIIFIGYMFNFLRVVLI